MPHSDPLTRDDLHAIRLRYEVTPARARCMFDGATVERDMTILLAEVDRLRGMVGRMKALRHRFPKPSSCLDAIWDDFRRELDQEANMPPHLQIPQVFASSWTEPFVGPPERWQVRAAEIGAAKRKPRRR